MASARSSQPTVGRSFARTGVVTSARTGRRDGAQLRRRGLLLLLLGEQGVDLALDVAALAVDRRQRTVERRRARELGRRVRAGRDEQAGLLRDRSATARSDRLGRTSGAGIVSIRVAIGACP